MKTSRTILWAILLLILPLLACGKHDDSTAAELTTDGWSRFEAGDYAGAEGLFTDAIAADVGFGDAHNGLGWTRLRTAAYASALEAFDAALSYGVTTPDPLIGKAIINLDVEPTDIGAAIEDALAALVHSPDYLFTHDPRVDWHDVRLLLARAYVAQADYGHADEQVGLLGGNQQGSMITSGLVAYWSFDEDFTATIGGAAYDCTPHGGVERPMIGGRFGHPASFTRADREYLSVDAPVITQGEDHSFSAWYRLDDSVSDIEGDDRYFVLETTGIGGVGAVSVSYGLRSEGRIDVGQFITMTPQDMVVGPSLQEACGTAWHNIIVTYNADNTGAEHSVYLDGIGMSTLSSGSLLKETAGLIIGGHRDGTGRNWDGQIDDVAFWNRVLSAEEIAAIQRDAIGELDVSIPSPTFIRDLLSEIERLGDMYGH